MKLKYLFISILFLAFACQNAPKENAEQASKTTETKEELVMANAQKVKINITGMTCTGCENAIQETINGFEGVYSSKADFQNGTAILEFDSTKVEVENIKTAINDLGYEAKEHNIIAE